MLPPVTGCSVYKSISTLEKKRGGVQAKRRLTQAFERRSDLLRETPYSRKGYSEKRLILECQGTRTSRNLGRHRPPAYGAGDSITGSAVPAHWRTWRLMHPEAKFAKVAEMTCTDIQPRVMTCADARHFATKYLHQQRDLRDMQPKPSYVLAILAKLLGFAAS